MSDNKTQLLIETVKLFNMMGVQSGVGVDGMLMSRIVAELDGNGETAPPVIEMPRGMCPLCGARDLTSCDCDISAQLEAIRNIPKVTVKL